MSSDELLTRLRELNARAHAHRGVLARLVAHLALRSPNPMAVVRDISDATDHELHQREAGRDTSEEALAFVERWRQEVDQIVKEATRLVSLAENR